MSAKDEVVRIGVSSLTRLNTQFNVQNLKVIQGTGENPYDGKIPTGLAPDDPLYQSLLGTPIYADLTLGDAINPNANSYTDTSGIVRRFNAITFATVLITIAQSKKIVKTEIQGRDGTIKEYIGKDDYVVTINGILPGSNGRYPRDDVSSLNQLLDAPITIAAVSWWLQLFNIHSLVIQDFNIPQLPGDYSQQSFSITALSDAAQEIKFIPGA